MADVDLGNLAVYLRARVDKLEADLRVGRAATDKATKGMQASFDHLSSSVQGKMQGLAANFGSVGTSIAALGPIGLAAAAAIAVLSVGFKQAASASLALADRAGKMKDFAETTGLTVIQIQALQTAGAQVGLANDSITTSLERLSISMVDVRNRTGPLYEGLLQIDRALAEELSNTTSLSEAWDVLAKAVAKADLEKANKLARAGFGRGGVGTTRLLRETDQAGGIDKLASSMNQLDFITAKQAKRWDELGDNIAENMKKAKTNVVSIFATPTLEALNEIAAGFVALSRATKELAERAAPSSSQVSGWDNYFKVISWHAFRLLPIIGLLASAIEALQEAGKKELATPPAFRTPAVSFRFETDQAADAAVVTAALEKQKQATIQLYNDEKRRIEQLGGAATAQDRYRLEVAKATSDIAEFGESVRKNVTARLADANTQMKSSALSARIALLGDMAKANEIEAQTEYKINEAIKQRATFTRDEIAAIKARDVIRFNASVPENQIKFERELLFLTDEEGKIRQRMIGWGIELNNVEGQRLATQMRINEEMAQVRGLINSSIDKTANSFADIIDGTKDAKTAFKDLARSVVRDLTVMIIKAQLFRAVSGAFGGFGGFGGGADPGKGGVFGLYHNGGVIGKPSATRFVHPAYFDNAPRMHSGGKIGSNERAIIAEVGEIMLPKGSKIGGGNQVNIKVFPAAAGETFTQRTGSDGSIELMGQMIKDFSERALPSRVAQINANGPRVR